MNWKETLSHRHHHPPSLIYLYLMSLLLYSWSYRRCVLSPTLPRPICMSRVPVANGALGRMSPITAFHSFTCPPFLMRPQDVVVVCERRLDSLWYAPRNCGDKSLGDRDTLVLRWDAWFDGSWFWPSSTSIAVMLSSSSWLSTSSTSIGTISDASGW